MWQGFLIALREGLESFLIVGLTVAYLRRTQRERLVRAVAFGIAVSIVLCAVSGYALFQQDARRPLREGLLACVAAALVGSLLVYMLRTARTMKATMERNLERAAGSARLGGFGGVFLFTVLMISREGIETTLLATTALFQVRSTAFVMGLVMGLGAAAVVAVTWKSLGRRVNLGILLNASAVFLSLFLLQLVLYAVHELSEAGLLPNAQTIHDATEILGPDGAIGHVLTYLLAGIPTAWLAYAWWKRRRQIASSTERPPAANAPRAA
jgi:high-affinity iron transporter